MNRESGSETLSGNATDIGRRTILKSAALALAGKIADAWIQFARTGDPNHSGIPYWAKFAAKTVPTMMFDNVVKLALNPDALELESIA